MSGLVDFLSQAAQAGFNPGAGGAPVTPSMKRFRTALAKTLSGQSNTRILVLSDSTGFGVGSTNILAEPNLNVWKQSWPRQLASILTAAGYPASCNGSTCANPLNSWNTQSSDGRYVFGSAWSMLMGTPSLGGGLFQAAAAGGPLAYTPDQACDSFRVWYVQNTGLGTMGLAISAGTVTNQSTAGTTGYTSVTKTGALAANTLNLSWISGQLFASAIEAWNSQQIGVQITNAGWPGAKLADISAGPTGFNPLGASLAFAPDLYIVCIGINDWNGGTPLATYAAALPPFLVALQAKADVVLVSPAPSSVSGTGISDATQQGFVSAMQSAAISVGIPFIDNWTRLGDWNANQQMYAPGNTGFIHPNMIGYSDFARSIARVLTAN